MESGKEVTIAVVPRESYSSAVESLESIYSNTNIPFDLVYVDSNSYNPVKKSLKAESKKRNFLLVSKEYFLSPNQARNLALKHVSTPYVVFIDNDVIVLPGWLENLLKCAKETKASVVTPLICFGRDYFKTVHAAGGALEIEENKSNGKRVLKEEQYLFRQELDLVKNKLQREETELAEFHCMLVETQLLKEKGGFDEGLLATREHVDFCLDVINSDKKIYFEPTSIVNYIYPTRMTSKDYFYYAIRWSDIWLCKSLYYFYKKWNLKGDNKFKKKVLYGGYRRIDLLLPPVFHKSKMISKVLKMLIMPFEKIFNVLLFVGFSMKRSHLQGKA